MDFHETLRRNQVYTLELEERLAERSDRLEEVHLEAAIDAQVDDSPADGASNPNAVANCWSPYVPSNADRIAAFLLLANLSDSDVLLDIGCGDGRVCIAASSPTSSAPCRAVGIDVSPACITMARQIACEEGLSLSQCVFYQADMTVDADELLDALNPLSLELLSATVVYLFTFPTLLNRLIPLLARLFSRGKLRAVVTLTYHFAPDDCRFIVANVDEKHDFKLYSRVQESPIAIDP